MKKSPPPPTGRRRIPTALTLAQRTTTARRKLSPERKAITGYQAWCHGHDLDPHTDAPTAIARYLDAHHHEAPFQLERIRKALEAFYWAAGSRVMEHPAVRDLWLSAAAVEGREPIIRPARLSAALARCETRRQTPTGHARDRTIVLLHANGLHPAEIALLDRRDFEPYAEGAFLTIRAPRPLVTASRCYWFARHRNPQRCVVATFEAWLATYRGKALFPKLMPNDHAVDFRLSATAINVILYQIAADIAPKGDA
jgi:hypothetical protein